MTLHLKFWGTRGSIPRPQSYVQLEDRIRAILNAARPEDIATPADVDAFINGGCRGALPTIYGGNTACVQLREEGGPSLLVDFGSGARDYASHVMRTTGPVAPEPFHVLMSHFHWDHIMGFPFFMPAYIPGNVINIYSCHDNVEEAFRRQHGAPSFPVPFDVLGSEIRFHVIAPNRTHAINGFDVTPHELNHAGRAFGYRIERDGRRVVYASDAEHKPEMISDDYPYIAWVARGRRADLRRAVFAGRDDQREGGLGPQLQRRRRRARADGRRQASAALPSRATERRRAHRPDRPGGAAHRGDHAPQQAADAHHRRL